MKKLIGRDVIFEHRELSLDEARAIFPQNTQPYKAELLDDLAAEGETVVGIYTSGDFTDLCKGPHVRSSKEINPDALKLMRVAGAYWKSDETRPQLTRVYGVLFA